MKTSIATVSISGDLSEKLVAIAAAGFDGIEIFENDLLAFDRSPREIAAMARDSGLEITLFQPFRDFEGLPEPLRGRAFDRAEHKFDLMEELGAPLMLVCSSVSDAALGGIDRTVADFRELGERAARRGLKVGYEALAWGKHINDHRDAWEVVRRVDHPNVGIILDSFHTLARKIDVASIRSIPKDKIFIVQLADAPLINMDLLYWSRHFRNMPGEGDLPVKDFLAAVTATGYDGFLSLEIFNDQFRGGSAGAISADGHRSLIYLVDQVRNENPSLQINAPAMPPRIEVEGIEFVEFAPGDDDAEHIEMLFRSLGFVEAGRHVTKDVTWFRQGNINLLVNRELDGFASSAAAVHGTTVCAFALKVSNAAAALERSLALGAELFSQEVPIGQLVIPAIRGVGGVIYFVDSKSDLRQLWTTDFRSQPPLDATGIGLVEIDHIGETMDSKDMLSWLLFYSSILKAHKTPSIDIVDPRGIVQSQVIETDGNALRLTLNGAENRRTLAGRFIAESFGSGLQHLALLCEDIFATATALKANGFISLQISANYFDDVEARFGLAPDLTERLREFNILYDRDDGGEFFQIYAPAWETGFILEVVERRGQYRGYGAFNASIRIAAQRKQLMPEGLPKK